MATAMQKFQSRADSLGRIRLGDGTRLELIAECDKPYVAHMDGEDLIETYTPAKALKKFRGEI